MAPKFKYTFLRVPCGMPGGLACYGCEEVKRAFAVPTVDEIFAFCKHLFVKAQLSSECSIVCLGECFVLSPPSFVSACLRVPLRVPLRCCCVRPPFLPRAPLLSPAHHCSPPPPPTPPPRAAALAVYVERLMEEAQVPLLASNWRPIVLCGLLLASKVWQDLSSWNVEFSTIFPQFTLVNINRLERTFLHHIHWDLYISGR